MTVKIMEMTSDKDPIHLLIVYTHNTILPFRQYRQNQTKKRGEFVCYNIKPINLGSIRIKNKNY